MVSKGKVDYNNLFDMKPIWTVPETARFLSDYWVGEITEADVLRLALEGKLKLSVNILVKTPAKPYKFTSESGEGHPEELFFDFPRLKKAKVPDGVCDISGIYDLPMKGGELLDVRHELQKFTGFSAQKLGNLGGAFVEKDDGQVYQLQERTGDASLSNYWRPAQNLPEDIQFLFRSSALRELIEERKQPAKVKYEKNTSNHEEPNSTKQRDERKVKSDTHIIDGHVEPLLGKDDSEAVSPVPSGLKTVVEVERQPPLPAEIVNKSNLIAQYKKTSSPMQPIQRQALPETGYLRLAQIVGDRKAGIPAIIPVSKSTWWPGVKSGRFPPAYKLGSRITAWKTSDIKIMIELMEKGEAWADYIARTETPETSNSGVA